MSVQQVSNVNVLPVRLRSTSSALSERIDQALVGGEVLRTMDGASTIEMTVHDPHRKLLRDPLLVRGPGQLGYVDVLFDGIHWRLVKVEKQGDDLVLTFEDRAVAYLRRYRSPRKVSRSKMTRAEFAFSLVTEVTTGDGIAFYSPDMHKTQPIAPITSKRKKKTKSNKPAEHAKGIPLDRTDLKIKGVASTPMQLRLADRVLDTAYSLKAPPKAVLALVEACIVESLFHNSGVHYDLDSRGVLQVRDSTAKPMGLDNMDPEACANAFLTEGFYTDALGGGGAIKIARAHPEASPGRIAQGTQGSNTPAAYDQYFAEAKALIETYDPGLLDVNWNPSSGTAKSQKKRQVSAPFYFRRGGADGTIENSWTALQRLAHEVGWRCFCDHNVVTFASDATLLEAEPKMVLDEHTLGVSSIDFDVDSGKASLSATVVVRDTREASRPGMVVELRDVGPASGRWLLSSIRRPIQDARTELTLTAPSEADKEPAPDSTSVTVKPPDPLADPGPRGTGRVFGGAVGNTPKQIVDGIVLPIARKHGMVTGINAAAVAAANARHGPTVDGNRSDHQGPPRIAWAVDMSNGLAPTPQMDALAKELAHYFGIPWSGSGASAATKLGYRYQLLYRTSIGGNHYNHVHFGVKKVG